MRATIRQTLAGLSCEIVECGDGNLAVAEHRRIRPDWTVMDIGLPGLDGLAATRAIHEESPDAQVIILTTHDSPAFRAAAARAGAIAFIPKSHLHHLPRIVAEQPPSSSLPPSP